MVESLEPERGTPLPSLYHLVERHNLTLNMCGCFGEAASLCLARHHEPPIDFLIQYGGRSTLREVIWIPPDDRIRRTWGNVDETTEYAAYGLSIAAIEEELGLVVVGRADIRTGADWYLANTVNGDLEAAYRLEGSGVDHGNRRYLHSRLVEKCEQVRNGSSNLPAIVSVVGFLIKVVEFEDVDLD